MKLSVRFNYGHLLQGDIVFSTWDLLNSILNESYWGYSIWDKQTSSSNLILLDIKLFGKLWKDDNGFLGSSIHALSEASETI